MDLSALIFVALAVAWAVYLIPKALRHHEDSTASRTVDGFSDRLRVLARREPVGRSTSQLVVSPGRPSSTATRVALPEAAPADEPAERPVAAAVRRSTAARAARRRLRVVLTILLAGVVVGVLAGLGHVAWPFLGIPGGVLLGWLVACRLMVRKERAVSVPTRRLPIVVEEPLPDDEGPFTDEIGAVLDDDTEPEPEPVAEAAPGGWDPVPTTLPTYVGKEPAARRTVRTIDLDSTGVWSSGFSAADSALAREAEEAERTARAITRTVEDERRASGT